MREGFIAYGHDWMNPVAMPTSATEDGVGLAIGGQFHGTPRAQEARQITTERLAAGKSVGLSIGYEVDHRTDWTRLLAQYPDAPGVIRQYTSGKRITFRARKIHRPAAGTSSTRTAAVPTSSMVSEAKTHSHC